MKQKKEFRQRPLIAFYVLMAYILGSLVWWTYLLVSHTNSSFRHRQTMWLMEHPEADEAAMKATAEYQRLKANHDRQRWMIYGESSVFLILLVLGAVRVHKSYIKETELARQQRNFLLSITHELKSPLSSIKLGLETLQKSPLDPTKRQRLFDNSLEDVQRLQSLVHDILMTARFEDETYRLSDESVDWSALVKETAEATMVRTGSGHRLQLDIEPGIALNGDREALALVVSNLVDNAVKYSPLETPVEVKLTQERGQCVLTVGDHGPGIPRHERRRVFKRFYRIGSEETRQTKGTGLGLFIVKEVVKRHGGTVKVKENVGGGAILEVRLEC